MNKTSHPILVEPTCFCFSPYDDKKINEDENKEEFKAFVNNLTKMIDSIEKENYKIAVSKDLFSLYFESVPISIYQQHTIHDQAYKSLVKLAKDYFIRKLPKMMKTIHKFGDNSFEVSIDTKTINEDLNLHNTELYLNWIDMVGLEFKGQFFSSCLKSTYNTILNQKTFRIINDANQKEEIDVINEVSKFKNSPVIKLKLLKSKLVKPSFPVPCSGTGDHGSMWGPSIRSINDIPKMERDLLIRLIDTGLIKSITLLDFDNSYPAVNSAEIILKRMQQMDQDDVLYCILRGKGTKQHAQNIKLQVKKGTGQLIYDWFYPSISMSKLDLLIQESATTKEQ
ncbi:hypothetical protein ACFOGI_10630 [Virgibacillus xinjiangensis]|uniref:Uncharacterized protein n=1 Tax=Virgibacillus xinjiangensis TaxID=393090 RepID=A0ABV7CWM6_9BACI